jgi:hypothetical protein
MLSTNSKKRSNYLLLLPIAGAILFLFFYYIAALNYPGGSESDKAGNGFSWLHNYWCNLMNQTAINGEPNAGRPYAVAGMLVLCLSLGWFWYSFALYMPFKKAGKMSMQFSGVSSMCIAFFIFTSMHDAVINIAALFALVALTGTFVGLYKMKWRKLFLFGIFNLMLVVVNNYLYYGGGLSYLPVVQKITFVFFLWWICMVSYRLFSFTEKISAGIE